MRAVAGVCRRESTITRSGWRAVRTRRTSRRGSSSSTVPTPVSTAPARFRQAWPSLRAASPVIHWLAPLSRAVRPSSEAATFSRSQGRPRSMRETKPMLSSRASSANGPATTSMPAAREPRRALAGDERIRDPAIAMTTRPTPAAIKRIGAGRRAAVMRAGLERHEDGGAANGGAACCGVAQGHDLGMRRRPLPACGRGRSSCRRRRR